MRELPAHDGSALPSCHARIGRAAGRFPSASGKIQICSANPGLLPSLLSKPPCAAILALPNKKLNLNRIYSTAERVYNVFCYHTPGEGIIMADGYGPSGQDPRDDSRQDNTYHYNYSYGSGRGTTPSGGYKPPRNSNDWGEWVGIGFLLFILPFWFCKLIGVVWLLNKLGKMTASDKRRYKQEAKNAANRAKNTAQSFFQQNADAARQAADSARQAAQGASAGYSYQYGQTKQEQKAPSEPWEQKAQPDAWNVRAVKRKKAKKEGGGTGLIVGGSVLTAIFGLSVFVLGIIGAVENVAEMLIPIGCCLPFLAGGIAMLTSGIGRNRRSERYLNYLAYIGANREVSLAPMAASFGVPVGKLCKDLRRMLAKGILPTGYLDLAEGKLFLTEMGYHAPEPNREAPPVHEETPQQAAAREDDILREIRQVNDQIPDAAMSAKIDRIEEITGKILKYQKEHPNKEGQLRTFLNYYLPTTLKILRAYAQLDAQGIEGQNISAAKKRIEDMMDQVVSGFEKQLDKLFQDDAMDITSDVEVLENMLKKDGLSDEGGITMTL